MITLKQIRLCHVSSQWVRSDKIGSGKPVSFHMTSFMRAFRTGEKTTSTDPGLSVSQFRLRFLCQYRKGGGGREPLRSTSDLELDSGKSLNPQKAVVSEWLYYSSSGYFIRLPYSAYIRVSILVCQLLFLALYVPFSFFAYCF